MGNDAAREPNIDEEMLADTRLWLEVHPEYALDTDILASSCWKKARSQRVIKGKRSRA